MMVRAIDLQKYDLPARTVIENIGRNHLAIVVNRKSRIIMSDGKKILEKANKIKNIEPKTKISLRTNAPVCSKTTKFLASHGIDVI